MEKAEERKNREQRQNRDNKKCEQIEKTESRGKRKWSDYIENRSKHGKNEESTHKITERKIKGEKEQRK